MLHRSRAARALSAAFAAACLLSVPAASAPAAEQPATRSVPADAPTVATTPSGQAAIAWVVGGRTCVVLQGPGAPRPTTLYDGAVQPAAGSVNSYEKTNGTCVTTPVLSQFHTDYVWALTRDESREVLLGVAGPGAARVEARRGGAVQSSSPAAAAPLPGPAGALRFWALERTRGDQQPDELAVLDASGTVRRAVAADDFGSWGPFAVDGLESPAGSGTLLRSGRAGEARWQLRRTIKQKLASTPLQPERRVEVRCLDITVRVLSRGAGADGGTYDAAAGTGPCDDDADLKVAPLVVSQESSCSAGVTLTVLALPSVRSVVVVQADGRRVRVALSALGGARGTRGGALVVAPTMGLRRLEGLAADGKVVSSQRLGTAPLQRDCSGSTSFITEGLFGGDPVLGAGPHALRVVDSGVELCLDVDRAPRVPQDCGVPPLDPEAAWVGALDVPGGQFVYGLVPVEVAAARLTFTDGAVQAVPVTPIPGYGGQYADTIAQIALDVPAPRAVRSVAVLDATGRVLGPTRTVGPFSSVTGAVRTLSPAASGLEALRLTPVDLTYGREHLRAACIGFRAVRRVSDPCELFLDGSEIGAQTISVAARCEPRRMVVLAVLRRSTDRLVVRLRGGREVVARSIRLPASAGRAAGRYVAFAVLKPRDAIASMRLRGEAARKLSLSYPAAADQCGYADTPGAAFS